MVARIKDKTGTKMNHSKKVTLGKIGNEYTMFMCMDAGSAKSEEHGEFELMYSMNGAPIVRSRKSGNCWYIEWSELIGLAIEHGIMQPFDEVKGELIED